MLASDHKDADQRLAHVLRPWTDGGRLDILEAGGGSLSHMTFRTRPHITVIDISAEQLARNEYADVKILGDLHTHEFSPESFDSIVCWNVLEHLENPRKVAQAFVRWLKPGGVVIIAAPNPASLTGLITKFTPHWFHVWVMRNVFGHVRAGEPGHGPFPTFMDPSISPKTLAREFEDAHLEIVHLRPYVSDRLDALRSRRPLLGGMYSASLAVLKAAAFGAWHPEYSDFHLVAQKPV